MQTDIGRNSLRPYIAANTEVFREKSFVCYV
jgi:hypothetical protein